MVVFEPGVGVGRPVELDPMGLSSAGLAGLGCTLEAVFNVCGIIDWNSMGQVAND